MRFAGVTLNIGLAAIVTTMVVPLAASAETLGFVSTGFKYAFDDDFDKACPDGYSPGTEESFLLSLSPEERSRVEENPDQIAGLMYRYANGKGDINMCGDVEAFLQDPPKLPEQKLVQSNTAPGFDLDGSDGSTPPPENICPHDNFVSLDGQTSGIDNQLYRAIGCSKYQRTVRLEIADEVVTSLQTFLIEVTGVDDRRNDPEVEVGIYSSQDSPVLDVQGKIPPYGSFTISPNEDWHNKVRGKIVDGVLITEVMPRFRLKQHYRYAGALSRHGHYDFTHARLRLEIREDGKLTGLMGAYQPIENMWRQQMLLSNALSNAIGHNCASEYRAIVALADGDKDPETGRCDSISVAYDVEAAPAFVIHPEATGNLQVVSNDE